MSPSQKNLLNSQIKILRRLARSYEQGKHRYGHPSTCVLCHRFLNSQCVSCPWIVITGKTCHNRIGYTWVVCQLAAWGFPALRVRQIRKWVKILKEGLSA